MSTSCTITTKAACFGGGKDVESPVIEGGSFTGNKTSDNHNNLLPLGSINSGLFILNFKIRYDIQTLRARIQKAVDSISATFGCPFTFSLEPGCKWTYERTIHNTGTLILLAPIIVLDLTIDEAASLRDTTPLVENSSLACKLYYKPSTKEAGAYLVVGLLNHILFDRRVVEMIFVGILTYIIAILLRFPKDSTFAHVIQSTYIA